LKPVNLHFRQVLKQEGREKWKLKPGDKFGTKKYRAPETIGVLSAETERLELLVWKMFGNTLLVVMRAVPHIK
jgi:hypothetical protein